MKSTDLLTIAGIGLVAYVIFQSKKIVDPVLSNNGDQGMSSTDGSLPLVSNPRVFNANGFQMASQRFIPSSGVSRFSSLPNFAG